MANVFQDKNWILDTASTTALLLGITHMISIARLRWKPNADGNTLIIKDMDGKVKFSDEATGKWPDEDPGREHDFKFIDPPLRMKGFILHTMGGGTLEVDLAG